MFGNDITACELKDCKRSQTCHRFLVERELGQSYFMWPEDFDSSKCEMYWEEETKEKYKGKAKRIKIMLEALDEHTKTTIS
jgi:hypothetical protein